MMLCQEITCHRLPIAGRVIPETRERATTAIPEKGEQRFNMVPISKITTERRPNRDTCWRVAKPNVTQNGHKTQKGS
jgi:hypothetical protein